MTRRAALIADALREARRTAGSGSEAIGVDHAANTIADAIAQADPSFDRYAWLERSDGCEPRALAVSSAGASR